MSLTRLGKTVTLGLGALLWNASALADWNLNMTESVTDLGKEIFDLHTLVMWVCLVIGVIVYGLIATSLFLHRKSRGQTPATFHENTTLEILWTVIPFVILVAIAIPATSTLLKLEDSSKADISIKITGYQWKWSYDYLDEDISYFSHLAADSRAVRDGKKSPEDVDHYLLDVDKPLVLPVGKKIQFLVTANDVIHSWWVPDLAVKQDAIPGYINDTWAIINEPGTYRGQCAELCGKDHGYMPIVVIAKTAEDYAAWVAEQKAAQVAAAASADQTWSLDELMVKGKEVYDTNCAACHMAEGQGMPAAGFPALAGSAIAKGPMADHLKIVMEGKSATAMQAFAAQLSDVEMAAIVTYERNAWGNNMGDSLQPSDVKAVR